MTISLFYFVAHFEIFKVQTQNYTINGSLRGVYALFLTIENWKRISTAFAVRVMTHTARKEPPGVSKPKSQ